jgi:alpha-1,2-mannosyltransferase
MTSAAGTEDSRGAESPQGRQGLSRRVPPWLLVLAAIISVGAALAAAVARDGLGHPIDFDIYRMGAAHVFGPHLYDVRLPRAQMGGARGMHFTYPPFAALVFLPFTWLPVVSGQVLWTVLSVTVLAALTVTAIRAARPEVSSRWAWTAAAIALLPVLRLDPVALTVAYGQINLILVLLVLVDLTTTVRVGSRVLPRGVLVGVAAAIKLTPLIFVPYLFLTRQVKAGVMALLAFAGSGLAAFALAPRSSWRYWSAAIFSTKGNGNVLYISDQNLHSALQRILGSVPAPAVAGALALVAAVGGLALATWAHRASSAMLGILTCAVTGLIVSPVSWAHHYVWIVPVLGWLLLGHDRPRGGRWWALAAAILFWAAPIWWLPVPARQTGYGGPLTILGGNAFFFAAVLFLLLTAVMLWHRGRAARQGEARPSRSAIARALLRAAP